MTENMLFTKINLITHENIRVKYYWYEKLG